jgi:hypothetical protein
MITTKFSTGERLGCSRVQVKPKEAFCLLHVLYPTAKILLYSKHAFVIDAGGTVR